MLKMLKMLKMTGPMAQTPNKRKILFQNSVFEIVQIEWSAGSFSADHDHGFSQCMVLVQEGQFENTLILGSKREVQIFGPGQVIETPIGASHEVRNLKGPGQTLHIYSPPLKPEASENIFSAKKALDLSPQLNLGQAQLWPEVKSLLTQSVQSSISTQSPFFMNQLFSGLSPQGLEAEKVISQTRTTMATFEASPVFTQMELEIVQELGRVIGWPQKSRSGVGVPGGSAANFMAVHLARHKNFPNTKTQGAPSQKLKVFVSAEAHYSLKKACAVLGLGTDNLVSVKTNSKGQINPESLQHEIEACLSQGAFPLMVCATAGTTVLGAFDPLEEISILCEKYKIWLHVDAAWGAPALFSEKIRSLVNGIEKADSVTFDAHKFFGASLTCSFFLTRHPDILLQANDITGADYLFHDHHAPDLGKLSWQCGRRADSVSFWALWKNLGTQGLGESVDRLLKVRDEVLTWVLDQPRLQLVASAEYLNVCLRVKAPADQDGKSWAQKVRQHLISENQAMVNFAQDSEGDFLRLILVHQNLNFETVQKILVRALQVGFPVTDKEINRDSGQNQSNSYQR
jgi:glutamate/tyrosine decarboxylase-like PLP-dependent enzyme